MLPTETNTQAQSKGVKKKFHASVNQERAGVPILISEKK